MRRVWQNILSNLLTILLALSTTSCEKDDRDHRYPSALTDYACLITNASGTAHRLCLDNGTTYPIALTNEFYSQYEGRETTFIPDTLYRVISIYEPDVTTDGDSVAYIYAISEIVSVIPTPMGKNEKLHQDPVYLQSIWISGGYLNIILEIKALNGRHQIGFVDTTPKSMNGKEFTFYHHIEDDVESYRQKLYASIPLYPFKESLTEKDTLRFAVNLYDKGHTIYKFIMP